MRGRAVDPGNQPDHGVGGVPASRRPTGVVIAWMPVSQRSATIASRLGYELLLVGRRGFRSPWSAPLAYPISAIRTATFIVRHRPRAVIVVTPPIVAALVVAPLALMLGAPFAIDVHTGALRDRRWRWSAGVLRLLGRLAAASVVTLSSLAPDLERPGARIIVAPDPLPDLRAGDRAPGGDGSGSPLVVAICGWGDDEPIDALVASAAGSPWRLVLTGRPRRRIELPRNVSLSGFLSPSDYASLLSVADVVVVLTTREDTLLSGAWEALALGRPLIVSGTTALRETFGDEVAYTGPEPQAIAEATRTTLADPEAAARVHALADAFREANDRTLAELATALGTPMTQAED